MSFSRPISWTIGPIFAPVIEHSLIFSTCSSPDLVLTCMKLASQWFLCLIKGLPCYDVVIFLFNFCRKPSTSAAQDVTFEYQKSKIMDLSQELNGCNIMSIPRYFYIFVFPH